MARLLRLIAICESPTRTAESVDEVAPEEQKINQVKTGDLSEHPDVSAQRRHDASIPEGLFAGLQLHATAAKSIRARLGCARARLEPTCRRRSADAHSGVKTCYGAKYGNVRRGVKQE